VRQVGAEVVGVWRLRGSTWTRSILDVLASPYLAVARLLHWAVGKGFSHRDSVVLQVVRYAALSDAVSQMEQITKIGFYSPERPEDPLERFISVLERKTDDDLKGSLIVLPEAFNIGVGYSRNETEVDTSPTILGQLQNVCTDFDVCLVAGLILTFANNPTYGKEPYNSAYLVDTSGFGLLCHKQRSDNQGPYSNCLTGCDGHNAVQYRNVAVASLICMDAYKQWEGERDKTLMKRLSLMHSTRLLCIPAYIENGEQEFVAMPNGYRIVANSANRTKFQTSPGSFIDRIDEQGNEERLVSLDNDDPPSCVKTIPVCDKPI
jgi:predicted amidohydrolase